MKRYIGSIIVMMGVVSIFFFTNATAFAKETSFSVKAKIPDSQLDKKKTSFDLPVKPGEVYDLEVEVKNYTNKEITVAIQANNATTMDDGVINYEKDDTKLDESMVYPFFELVKVDSEIKLAPNETKTVVSKVTLPKESFDGVILGGLQFTKIEETKKNKAKSKSNQTQVIGVQLSENDKPVVLDFDILDVKAGQVNSNNTVLVNVQNPTSKIINSMIVTAGVFKENDNEKPIYQNKKENLNMAPNSNFNYGISTENKPFIAGKYVLKMLIEADGKKWDLEENFEIKDVDAKTLNAKMTKVDETTPYLLYSIIGGIVFVLVIGIPMFWLWYHKKRNKKRNDQCKKTNP